MKIRIGMMSAAIAAVLIVGAFGRARADMVNLFNVNATLTGGVRLGGTLTIDTTTGTVQSANLTASVPTTLSLDISSNVTGTPNAQGTGLYVIQVLDSGGFPAAVLGLQETSLVGFNGGAITTGSGLFTDGSTRYGVIAGTIGLAPEPSSLVMSGMGLAAGLAGFALRRRARSSSSK